METLLKPYTGIWKVKCEFRSGEINSSWYLTRNYIMSSFFHLFLPYMALTQQGEIGHVLPVQ